MAAQTRQYKYLEYITVALVVILLISNLVGSIKVTRLCIPTTDWCLSFTTGLFLFPASYLIGDILTEVYGYDKSRKVIWTGFGALLVTNLIIQFFIILPADPNWGLQNSYSQIFNQSFRISMASMVAYFCGEFTNSYVVAKLKVWTKGEQLALRLIASTMAGELVDSLIIYPLGFLGAPGYTLDLMIGVLITNYIIKVLWEIAAYPFTRLLLKWLKKAEHEDFYDYKTDFNPFHVTVPNSV